MFAREARRRILPRSFATAPSSSPRSFGSSSALSSTKKGGRLHHLIPAEGGSCRHLSSWHTTESSEREASNVDRCGRPVRILLRNDLVGSRAYCRAFSSGKEADEDPSEQLQQRKEDGGSSAPKGGAADTYSTLAEPDFATSYLGGEGKKKKKKKKKKPPVVVVTEEGESRRRNRKRILVNPDRELIKEIRKVQDQQKAQARRKTASNVYRALGGNLIICVAKLGAWASSGSSGMLAEFIHSVVDCGNQTLLLVGLRDAGMVADGKHPYGYGKSVYFWALVSALGTFFLGAGVSMTHAVSNVMNPSLHEVTWQVWGVLVLSFTVDGYVFKQTLAEIMATRPKDVPYLKHIGNVRDPATLAILLEDGAACLGVVIALGGIVASHATGLPVFDGMAGVAISTLLGLMGVALVKVNHRFLLGHAVDHDITDDIAKILRSRRSIDSIGSVQSQWTGPDTFSYKAEVDFDGTYLAAKLVPLYQEEFLKIRDSMEDELDVLLAFFAEDVIRTVEREVRHAEAQIRKKYPGAEYIELEPMSLDVDRLAIDDNLEAELKRVESDALNRYLRTLKKEGATQDALDPKNASSNNNPPEL